MSRLAPLAYAKVGADSFFALQHQQRVVIQASKALAALTLPDSRLFVEVTPPQQLYRSLMDAVSGDRTETTHAFVS